MPRRKFSGRRLTMRQQSLKKSPEEKAVYHNVTGAGKSRVIREFFALNDRDVQQIVTLLERRLSQRLSAN
jgi:hypothetical protein